MNVREYLKHIAGVRGEYGNSVDAASGTEDAAAFETQYGTRMQC